VDIGIVRGLITAILLVLFLAIWAWTCSHKRQTDFDAASRLPLGDDEMPPANEDKMEQDS